MWSICMKTWACENVCWPQLSILLLCFNVQYIQQSIRTVNKRGGEQNTQVGRSECNACLDDNHKIIVKHVNAEQNGAVFNRGNPKRIEMWTEQQIICLQTGETHRLCYSVGRASGVSLPVAYLLATPRTPQNAIVTNLA